MARVTGIGGVFFRSKGNAKELSEWYKKNLGLPLQDSGLAKFNWSDDRAGDAASTAWRVSENTKEWFSPSQSDFMINYRVDDLEEMISHLKENGVTILKDLETHQFGKFASIMDPDGNRIELWEDDKNKKP
jgi:uncharacterized glyoxalase superfamily protein PhnB